MGAAAPVSRPWVKPRDRSAAALGDGVDVRVGGTDVAGSEVEGSEVGTLRDRPVIGLAAGVALGPGAGRPEDGTPIDDTCATAVPMSARGPCDGTLRFAIAGLREFVGCPTCPLGIDL